MQHTPSGVILIVCLVFVGMALAKMQRDDDFTYAAAEQEYNQSKAIAPLGNSAKTKQTDAKLYREEWRAEQDLAAQRDMAKWALWMLIATGASAFVTLAGIFFVAQTLDATRASLNEARRSANAAIDAVRSERAWITFEQCAFNQMSNGRINGQSYQEGLDIQVAWSNRGRSPATNVQCYFEYAIVPSGGAVPHFALAQPSPNAGVIGPNYTFFAGRTVIIDPNLTAVNNRGSDVAVYCRVTYRDLVDGTIERHTEVCGLVSYYGEAVEDEMQSRKLYVFRVVGDQNTAS